MEEIGSISKKLKNKPHIYRIELLDRFEKLLTDKELVFVQPSVWQDPLENLIFNAQILKDGKQFHHPSKDKIYSQCWSSEGDSYALWQIYTTKANNQGEFKRHFGVRMTTKFDRLSHISTQNPGKFYFGEVKYLWKYQMEELLREQSIIDALRKKDLCIDHLKTLLVKRKSYHYENEVRLLGIPTKEMIDAGNKKLWRLKIEPLDFITSVRFDPAMPFSDFKIKKEELVDSFGFKPTQVTQSSYFKQNKYIIRI